MTTKGSKITQQAKSLMVGIGTYVAIGVNSFRYDFVPYAQADRSVKI